MGAWTHALCDECWWRENQDRDPVRLQITEVDICCLCGMPTTSGIYIRMARELCLTRGEHV
jgi:hypothetical protein